MRNCLLAIVVLALLCSSGLAQPSLKTLNRDSPGRRFELEDYLRGDRLNVIVFSSRHSSACREMMKKLSTLASQNAELNVSLIDIDRPGSQSIDWRSPLVRQFNLRTLPYIQVYQGRELEYEGHPARKWLLKRWDEAVSE